MENNKINLIKKKLKEFNINSSRDFNFALETLSEGLNQQSVNNWADIILSAFERDSDTLSSSAYINNFITASPKVFSLLPQTQFIEWSKQSLRIFNSNNIMGESYVSSSVLILKVLRPRHLMDWGNLGLKLFKSAKNTNKLALKFYDISPSFVQNTSFEDLELLVDTADRISLRSISFSTKIFEWVNKISTGAPKDVKKWNTLINDISKILIKDFEDIFRNLAENADLINNQRGFIEVLNLCLNDDPQYFKSLLNSSVIIFKNCRDSEIAEFIDMINILSTSSISELNEFATNFKILNDRISPDKFRIWFKMGIQLYNDQIRPPGGYYSLESIQSKSLFNELTFSVDLDIEKDLIKLYCCALSGEDLGIQSSNIMVEKEIGWFNSNLATTEGSTIYLPSSIKKFNKKEKNFSWLKVIATHQVGHVEFGTFKFDLNKSSQNFEDIRYSLINKMDKVNPESSTELTDMSRLFKFFEDSKLAEDIFSIFEAHRVDSMIIDKYKGIAKSFKEVQVSALVSRPLLNELPARELLLEALIKYSLKPQVLKIPKNLKEHMNSLLSLMKLLSHNSNIEDTAEAMIRAYKILLSIENIIEDDYEQFDFDDETTAGPELSNQDILDFFNFEPETTKDSQELDSSDNTLQNEELLEKSNDYSSPQDVEFWGEFKPELSQLMLEMTLGESEFSEEGDLSELSSEQIEEMLKDSVEENTSENGEDVAESDITQNLQDAINELESESTEDDGKFADRFDHFDEQGKPLKIIEADQYLYDEWDFSAGEYKKDWCLVNEKKMTEGDLDYYEDTLAKHADIVADIKRQFELINPETYRKIKRLEDGEEQDLDLVVEAMVDLRSGISPSEKLYWRRNKVERSISVAFLLDMSASTAEAIDDTDSSNNEWSAPDDPEKYMEWLRKRRSQGFRRTYKRIVDLEKEGLILLLDALEALGDTYGIFGFSGYGRENVEFFNIKDLNEKFSDQIPKRIDNISPLHATRMGPAIRHTITKLLETDEKSKFIFLISDGRPQDRGYSREGVEKEYAVNDTKKALLEAKENGITTFCLTVDKDGHDYMKSMMEDLSYEILDDIASLPLRIPQLYKNLTSF